MTNFPTCPHCGGEFIPISYNDFDAESGYIIVTIYGECDTCHKNFS